MTQPFRFAVIVVMLVAFWCDQPLAAQDDVADIISRELRVGEDENKRYFLIEPEKSRAIPEQGYGLVVVLPGGDGSAEFHPFVKRIFKNAVPAGYLLAQPIAVKWTENQQVVWPTKKNRAPKMQFATEDFVGAVITDVAEKHKLDPARVFTLTWSSSGPAAYAVSLSGGKVTGSFIAMSVFKPDLLPSLQKAKGHGYYLYHSPDDKVCPFRMAERAAKDLEKNGASVKLTSYDGGHGWQGPVFDEIRQGLEWLEKNHATSDKAK